MGSKRPPKAKAKAYNTCRAPQVTYRDFRGAGHITGQASVSMGRIVF